MFAITNIINNPSSYPIFNSYLKNKGTRSIKRSCYNKWRFNVLCKQDLILDISNEMFFALRVEILFPLHFHDKNITHST